MGINTVTVNEAQRGEVAEVLTARELPHCSRKQPRAEVFVSEVDRSVHFATKVFWPRKQIRNK